MIALSSEVRRVSYPRPLRHIVGIRDTECSGSRQRPDEGRTYRDPQRRSKRIRAVRNTIDGVEERGLGPDDRSPVDAVGRVGERICGGIRTGHPVSVHCGARSAISVCDGADGRGGCGTAHIRHCTCAVILIIGHCVDPYSATGVARRRGNRAAILG